MLRAAGHWVGDVCGVVGLCGAEDASCPPSLRWAAGTAVRSHDRHVMDPPPSWGEAVALWVVVVPSARRKVPLDLGTCDHQSLDVVLDANGDHDI